MTKYMNDHLSLIQIESEIKQLHESIQRKASNLTAARSQLTDEGFTKQWERSTAAERARLAELTGVADGWAASARTAAEKVRAAQFPQPTDSQRDGAERTAARILGRNLDNKAAVKLLRDMEPSPAKSIVMEELQARGVIGADMVHGVLCEVSEEYRDATRTETNADAAASVLNRRLGAVGEQLEMGQRHDHGVGGVVETHPTLKARDLGPLEDFPVANVPGADVKRPIGKLIAAD